MHLRSITFYDLVWIWETDDLWLFLVVTSIVQFGEIQCNELNVNITFHSLNFSNNFAFSHQSCKRNEAMMETFNFGVNYLISSVIYCGKRRGIITDLRRSYCSAMRFIWREDLIIYVSQYRIYKIAITIKNFKKMVNAISIVLYTK